MENKLKLKVSRMFRSSLDSCRSKSISDVSSEQPFFFPENHHHRRQLIELFSPKPPPSRPFPSLCRPKSPENETSRMFPRTKITGRTSLLPSPSEKCHRNLSPETPIPHFTTDFDAKPKHRKQRSKSRKTRKIKNQKFDEFFNSVAVNYYGWYSSDDEKEKIKDDDDTTFFSSKSMSSDSSESFRAGKNKNAPAPEKKERNKDSGENDENELMKICGSGKVKDSYAVIKRSSDPYNDFRTSMVEMIVEKQIFGSKDLENLLQLFLSLNSVTHHTVIIEVFTEIWETLFSDWS